MQRNRTYNQDPEGEYRRRNRQEDHYYRQESRYGQPQPDERPWRPQQFPDRYSSNYTGPDSHRHSSPQPDYGHRDFRQDSRDREHRADYRYEDRGQSHLDPSAYRGAYRLDVSGENRRDYQRLEEENFGRDYGYGHAGNSRNGGDRGRHQSDFGNGATYGASRNAGSMGSYGGAQGYGSSRNGGHTSEENWASGHGSKSYQPEHRIYGAYRDKNSFAPGENPTYDGSQRYGSQGAAREQDNWIDAGRRSKTSRYRTSAGQDEDDSRYEIYDTALSQYNRGDYGNSTHGSISDELNLRSHQDYPPYQYYGSRQRGRNRQGSGSDQEHYGGAGGMGYNNTAGSLSYGYDGYRGPAEPRYRYYDPLTGDMRNPY